MTSALSSLYNDSTNPQDSLLTFEIVYIKAIVVGATKDFRAIV